MSSSSSSLSSSPLGDDTAAAAVAPTAAAATAAMPVQVQADKPSTNGKKRSTEGEIADGATTNTTTTARSTAEMPPPSSSSSTNTGGDVVDGATTTTSTSSSKRPRNDTQVPEEWSNEEDAVLLEMALQYRHITNAFKKWQAVATAVMTKTTKTTDLSICWNRYDHLQRKTIDLQRETIDLLDKEIEERERARKMISLEMVLSLPEGHFKLVRTGSRSSHVYGKQHVAAEAVVEDFPLVDITKELVMQELKKLKSDTPSQLIQSFWDKKTTKQSDVGALDEHQFPAFKEFLYSTEADIADLAKQAVADAINILQEFDLKTYEKLSVQMEMQLFSYKPDILVVRCNNNPIFAVQVKKPLPENNNKGLACYATVLGQTFDYLKLLEALGYRNSLVVTTTFVESFASWTNGLTNKKGEEESPTSYSPDDCLGQIILSATSHGQSSATDTKQPANTNRKSPPVSKVRSTAENKTAFSESPPMLKAPPSPVLRNIISSDSPERRVDFTLDTDRTMTRSKVETSDELVWLLCRSISLAVRHDTQPTRTIWDLQPEKFYLFPKVLRVTKREYAWGSLKVRINNGDIDRAEAVSRSSVVGEEYYIIGILGHGDTSSVYHALDRDGKQVAIKVYVKATDDNEKWLSSKDFKKAAADATNRESEFLLSFYAFLKGKVHVMELFDGFSCLVMPLFKPVAKKDRISTLKSIEQTLRGPFFNKKKKYRDGDVRWRHVGFYNDGKAEHCILYDLADLEKLEESEDSGELVSAYVRTLKSRIESEEMTHSEMFKSSEAEELT